MAGSEEETMLRGLLDQKDCEFFNLSSPLYGMKQTIASACKPCTGHFKVNMA